MDGWDLDSFLGDGVSFHTTYGFVEEGGVARGIFSDG